MMRRRSLLIAIVFTFQSGLVGAEATNHKPTLAQIEAAKKAELAKKEVADAAMQRLLKARGDLKKLTALANQAQARFQSAQNELIKATAIANKALVLDSSSNITSINSLTATNLTGTLQTASQPNITSVGTLNNLMINGNVNIATHNGSTSGLELNGTLILSTATEINYLKDINPGIVIGNKVLAVDNNKDLLGFRDISLNGNLSTAQITLNGFLIQSTADEINYLYNITKGLASNNKAVVLPSSPPLIVNVCAPVIIQV